jgi:hypothetical protein
MEKAANLRRKLSAEIKTPVLSTVTKYHLEFTALLSAVPLVCGLVLLLLLTVFAKLNLYFLEASGLLIDDQLRQAYYRQVEFEMFGVIGYLLLLVLVTMVASFVVMRWATAPFLSAERMVRTAMTNPDALRPASRWLSESPAFDRLMWLFSLRVKSGGKNQEKSAPHFFGANLPFLAKFLVAFSVLSICTGYVLSIFLDSVYRRIVDLALHLLPNKKIMGHYFLAQQDILADATDITVGLALLFYFILGYRISRYMATMLQVFSRSVAEDRFPIRLRGDDIYCDLANTLNQARSKIP